MAYCNASNKLLQDNFKWGLIRRGRGLIREEALMFSNMFHKEKVMKLIIK